jgi:hypothetical protein
MTEYREFAQRLRTLSRSYDDPEVYMPIVRMAEEYEQRAEAAEMEQIVQAQRDWVEKHG